VSTPIPEPRHEYYESQRIRLHYAVWGDGDRPPLLLVHGGQDHCRNWDFVAARLIDSYTLYAPDLRGHGDSGWAIGGMYSLPEFVYDISVLADSLPRPLAVIGHSLGGAIALQYAGTFPDRVSRVIAIEGWGPPMIEEQPAHVRMRLCAGWCSTMGGPQPSIATTRSTFSGKVPAYCSAIAPPSE